jgi:two-component system cell cycle response regulator
MSNISYMDLRTSRTKFQQKRILIVEDDGAVIVILEESLRQEGYLVKAVTSVSEAMNVLNTFQPHLVLTDNDMQEKTGIEMLVDLRRSKNYVTVVFISGRSESEFVVAALRAGADDYILKPFRLNELLARVEVALRVNDVHRDLLEANMKLQDMVDHDELTGLFNMRSMYNKIDIEIKRAKRFSRNVACVMLDMDHFKTVNDDHDHLFGSFVLKEVGGVIKEILREMDFAARYGGDEYLIVLTETNPEGVKIFCERLRKLIEAKEFIQSVDRIRLTCSMGYSIGGTGDNRDARDLVREADRALYRAKAEGRNRICGPSV